MSWIQLVPQLLFFGVFMYGVGGVLLFALGRTRLRTYACAPVFTLAFTGLLTLVSPPVRWGSLPVLGGLVVALVLIIGIRCLARKEHPLILMKETSGCLGVSLTAADKGRLAAFGVGFAISAAIAGVLFVAPVPSPEALLQNYDDPFHFSVVRHILETGNASPFGAGAVAGNAGSLYPDLWHALVALIASSFGCGVMPAVWTVCMGVLIFMVPLGIVPLVVGLYRQASAGTLVLACVVPVLLPTSIAVFGFSFGILFANYLALATLPFALSLLLGCRFFLERDAARKVSVPWLVSIVLADACAVGLAHPNTVILLVLVATPFILTRIPAGWGVGLVTLGAVLWIVLFSSDAFARTVHCLDRVWVSEGIGRRFFQLLGIDSAAIAASEVAVAVVGMIPFVASVGLAWLTRRWAASWYLVSLGICFSLFVFSAFPFSEVGSLLTGFWYRDIFRFMVIATFLSCPVLVLVPQAITATICAHIGSGMAARFVHGVVALLCIAGCAYFLMRPAGLYPASLRDFNDVTLRIGGQAGFGEAQRSFCEQVTAIADGATILNSAEDESVWLYPAFGANALIKARPANYLAPMDADTALLVEGIDRIGEATSFGQDVREAAKRMGLGYVVRMSDYAASTVVYGSDGTPEWLRSEAILRITEETPGFSVAASTEDWTLFALEWDELP